MKTRKILAGFAAVAIGALGALALTTPAQAAYTAPTVTVTDACTGVGDRIVKITNTSADTKIDVQAVRGAVPTVLTATVGLAAGATADVTEDNWKAGFTLQYKKHGVANWDTLRTVGEWAAPANCKPVVDISGPSCDDPTLSVSISNPIAAKANIAVTFNSGGGATVVAPGDHYAIDGATEDVTYTWVASALGLNETNKVVKYAKPASCDPSKPGAGEVKPQPGKRVHGKGNFHHVPAGTPVTNAGNNAGNNGGETQESSTQAAGNAKAGGDDSLPVTGSPVRTVLYVGAVLLVAGLVAWAVSLRRRRVRFTSAG